MASLQWCTHRVGVALCRTGPKAAPGPALGPPGPVLGSWDRVQSTCWRPLCTRRCSLVAMDKKLTESGYIWMTRLGLSGNARGPLYAGVHLVHELVLLEARDADDAVRLEHLLQLRHRQRVRFATSTQLLGRSIGSCLDSDTRLEHAGRHLACALRALHVLRPAPSRPEPPLRRRSSASLPSGAAPAGH
jgi:hypothetical protein